MESKFSDGGPPVMEGNDQYTSSLISSMEDKLVTDNCYFEGVSFTNERRTSQAYATGYLAAVQASDTFGQILRPTGNCDDAKTEPSDFHSPSNSAQLKPGCDEESTRRSGDSGQLCSAVKEGIAVNLGAQFDGNYAGTDESTFSHTVKSECPEFIVIPNESEDGSGVLGKFNQLLPDSLPRDEKPELFISESQTASNGVRCRGSEVISESCVRFEEHEDKLRCDGHIADHLGRKSASDEPPYNCTQCGMSFALKHHLLDHEREVHAVLSCSTSNRRFGSSLQLGHDTEVFGEALTNPSNAASRLESLYAADPKLNLDCRVMLTRLRSNQLNSRPRIDDSSSFSLQDLLDSSRLHDTDATSYSYVDHSKPLRSTYVSQQSFPESTTFKKLCFEPQRGYMTASNRALTSSQPETCHANTDIIPVHSTDSICMNDFESAKQREITSHAILRLSELSSGLGDSAHCYNSMDILHLWRCVDCSTDLQTREELREHRRSCLYRSQADKQSGKNIGNASINSNCISMNSSLWRCLHCSINFQSRDELREHRRSCVYRSQADNQSGKNISNASINSNCISMDASRWRCLHCSTNFQSRDKLRKHRRSCVYRSQTDKESGKNIGHDRLQCSLSEHFKEKRKSGEDATLMAIADDKTSSAVIPDRSSQIISISDTDDETCDERNCAADSDCIRNANVDSEEGSKTIDSLVSNPTGEKVSPLGREISKSVQNSRVSNSREYMQQDSGSISSDTAVQLMDASDVRKILMFSCSFCSARYKTLGGLKHHFKLKHMNEGDLVPRLDRNSKSSSGGMYDKSCTGSDIKDVSHKAQSNFACHRCPARFISQKYLKEHYRQQHAYRAISCEIGSVNYSEKVVADNVYTQSSDKTDCVDVSTVQCHAENSRDRTVDDVQSDSALLSQVNSAIDSKVADVQTVDQHNSYRSSVSETVLGMEMPENTLNCLNMCSNQSQLFVDQHTSHSPSISAFKPHMDQRTAVAPDADLFPNVMLSECWPQLHIDVAGDKTENISQRESAAVIFIDDDSNRSQPVATPSQSCQCVMCGCAFPTLEAHRIHCELNLNLSRYICYICGQNFLWLCRFQRHSETCRHDNARYQSIEKSEINEGGSMVSAEPVSGDLYSNGQCAGDPVISSIGSTVTDSKGNLANIMEPLGEICSENHVKEQARQQHADSVKSCEIDLEYSNDDNAIIIDAYTQSSDNTDCADVSTVRGHAENSSDRTVVDDVQSDSELLSQVNSAIDSKVADVQTVDQHNSYRSSVSKTVLEMEMPENSLNYFNMRSNQSQLFVDQHSSNSSLISAFKPHIEQRSAVDPNSDLFLNTMLSEYQPQLQVNVARDETENISQQESSAVILIDDDSNSSHPAQTYQCVMCGCTFPTLEAHRIHCEFNLMLDELSCGICCKNFLWLCDFQRHSETCRYDDAHYQSVVKSEIDQGSSMPSAEPVSGGLYCNSNVQRIGDPAISSIGRTVINNKGNLTNITDSLDEIGKENHEEQAKQQHTRNVKSCEIFSVNANENSQIDDVYTQCSDSSDCTDVGTGKCHAENSSDRTVDNVQSDSALLSQVNSYIDGKISDVQTDDEISICSTSLADPVEVLNGEAVKSRSSMLVRLLVSNTEREEKCTVAVSANRSRSGGSHEPDTLSTSHDNHSTCDSMLRCNTCNRIFSSAQNLSLHEVSRACIKYRDGDDCSNVPAEYQHPCPKCPASFLTLGKRCGHVYYFHPSQELDCLSCNEVFSSAFCLVMHFANIHSHSAGLRNEQVRMLMSEECLLNSTPTPTVCTRHTTDKPTTDSCVVSHVAHNNRTERNIVLSVNESVALTKKCLNKDDVDDIRTWLTEATPQPSIPYSLRDRKLLKASSQSASASMYAELGDSDDEACDEPDCDADSDFTADDIVDSEDDISQSNARGARAGLLKREKCKSVKKTRSLHRELLKDHHRQQIPDNVKPCEMVTVNENASIVVNDVYTQCNDKADCADVRTAKCPAVNSSDGAVGDDVQSVSVFEKRAVDLGTGGKPSVSVAFIGEELANLGLAPHFEQCKSFVDRSVTNDSSTSACKDNTHPITTVDYNIELLQISQQLDSKQYVDASLGSDHTETLAQGEPVPPAVVNIDDDDSNSSDLAQTYPCVMCAWTFQSRQAHQIHCKSNLNLNGFNCGNCGKHFLWLCGFQRHSEKCRHDDARYQSEMNQDGSMVSAKQESGDFYSDGQCAAGEPVISSIGSTVINNNGNLRILKSLLFDVGKDNHIMSQTTQRLISNVKSCEIGSVDASENNVTIDQHTVMSDNKSVAMTTTDMLKDDVEDVRTWLTETTAQPSIAYSLRDRKLLKISSPSTSASMYTELNDSDDEVYDEQDCDADSDCKPDNSAIDILVSNPAGEKVSLLEREISKSVKNSHVSNSRGHIQEDTSSISSDTAVQTDCRQTEPSDSVQSVSNCRQTENDVNVSQPIENQLCELDNDQIDLMLENKRNTDGTRSYRCTMCFSSFESLNAQKAHCKFSTMEKGGYKCCICDKQFFWRCAFVLHEKICILSFNMLQQNKLDVAVETVSSSSCSTGQVTAQSNATSELSLSRSSSYSREQETRTVSHSEPKQLCSTATVVNSLHTDIHRSVVNTDSMYKCSKCGIGFNQLSWLHAHWLSPCYDNLTQNSSTLSDSSQGGGNSKNISSANPTIQYKCDNCGKRFSKYGYLKTHQEKLGCVKSRPSEFSDEFYKETHAYSCDLCAVRCKSRIKLVEHKKQCHTVFEKKCPLCEDWFFDQQLLRDHLIRFHDIPVKRFKCSNCLALVIDKAFPLRDESSEGSEDNLLLCDRCAAANEIVPIQTIALQSSSKRFQCSKCTENYKHRTSLLRHFVISHTENYKTFQCEKCPEIYKHRTSLKRHFLLCHAGTSDAADTAAATQQRGRLSSKAAGRKKKRSAVKEKRVARCEQKKRRSVSSVGKRNKQSSENKNSCQSDKDTSSLDLDDDSDATIIEDNNDAVSTDNYDVASIEVDGIGDDIQSRNRDVPLSDEFSVLTNLTFDSCQLVINYPVLNSSYADDQDLRGVTEQFTEEMSQFVCNLCSERFSLAEDLEVHRKTHGGERPYECTKCTSKFVSLQGLQSHNQSIHDSQQSSQIPDDQRNREESCATVSYRNSIKHQCEICGHLSYNNYRLRAHQSTVHSKPFFYQCNVCGKKFRKIISLENHKLVHAGVRKEGRHKCDICALSFHYSKDYRRHLLRSHAELGPVKCDWCGEMFSTEWYMQQHKKNQRCYRVTF